MNNCQRSSPYTLFLFNMIVPFQMVMFTPVQAGRHAQAEHPMGLCLVYLGFGASLAVFIFHRRDQGHTRRIEESP